MCKLHLLLICAPRVVRIEPGVLKKSVKNYYNPYFVTLQHDENFFLQ